MDRPLPLWIVFPVIFIAVYLSHAALLRLPYYWDEAGYYIPAAYDFLRTGSLIPSTTLSNAHPPLPSLYLALWWKTSGFIPAVTRTAMCMVAALALLAVYGLALRLNHRPGVAIWTTLLTGLYPVWFAQSTMAHADLFAAAATLWALNFVLLPLPTRRQLWAGTGFFALAALAKETAIITPLALVLYQAVQALRGEANLRLKRLANAAILLFPLLPLAIWYAYHRARTGYIFGNPEYLRYNATSTLTPLRVLVAFGHRTMQLTAHMNLFVPVLCMLAAMLLDPLREDDGELRPRIPLPSQARIYVVLLANAVGFSLLGGALLTRYLLPMYPLVLLLAVSTFRRRVRYWQALCALSALAFLLALFINPPYRFAPEDNLAYRDVILLHQQAVRQIALHAHDATVLTAWPASDELSKPEIGYVRKPIRTFTIDNFSAAELAKAAAQPGSYSAAFVFSTKYDPPHLPLNLGARNEALDERYFGFHHDLSPDEIARLLGGRVIWRGERDGQWAAVLQFDRTGPSQQ
ncbi:MAG TPA: hypothetical protein VM554_12665 [Acidisarcina sp.]|nr:hypothetical protein [Acidisarcina sp.]